VGSGAALGAGLDGDPADQHPGGGTLPDAGLWDRLMVVWLNGPRAPSAYF
jgi:hypothetical protein